MTPLTPGRPLSPVGAAGPFLGEVHPFADRFPMLDDESLKALAEDIAANGLLHPIVLDSDGVLIDGRCRLRACEIAGIEPEFVVFDGDPVAFIIGQNMQRRDLTQAQKAHIAVAGLSDSDNRQESMASIAGVARVHIAEAVVIRKYAPEASDAVIAGTMPHARAYEAAKAQKDDLARQAARRDILTTEAPDILATGLPLDEAWAAYQTRTREQREKAEADARNRRERSQTTSLAIAGLSELALDGRARQRWAEYEPEAVPPSQRLDTAKVREAIDGLTNLLAAMKEKNQWI